MPIFDPGIFDPGIFDAGPVSGIVIQVPAGVITLTGSTDRIVVQVPAGVITLASHVVGPGPGNPTYPWRLFRGMVIGTPKMTRKGDLLQITYDCEDYNRLAPLITVGIPDGFNFLHQNNPPPDGTNVAIDPRGQIGGDEATSALYVALVIAYWFPLTPISTISRVRDFGDPDTSMADFSIAMTDFKSLGDTLLAYMNPWAHAWIDADQELNVTILHGTGDLPTYDDPAPFNINDDRGPSYGVVAPMTFTPDWDFANLRSRVYINGGTPAATGWFSNPGAPSIAGEVRHDSPGAIYATDAARIAAFHIARTYRTFFRGTAHIEAGHDGWRPGQTAYLTSTRQSTSRRPISALSSVIQHVSGKLVGPGPGLTFLVGGQDVSDRVTITSFSFANSLSGPEKATITVEIPEDSVDARFDVAELADVTISTDGRALIEYDLDLGDIEPGNLAIEMAKFKVPLPPKPVYHFNVTIDNPIVPLIPGLSTLYGPVGVKAQLADDAEAPKALFGVIAEWVLLQWSDQAQTIPASGLSLNDPVGTTDAAGAIFTTISAAPDSDAVAYEIKALALPIP